ncbi:hypothetical protein AQUCO_00300795v1 [Aquilegia coerulea]|uniref:Uncharacterized protein n=1 Tax=Aquilegia coerulea TaxID=218851 RepID=A0A2G5F0I7_AQUCA|nr:hypothetical protein AQUCO_00300795v1 [Aquilegia coerulea]
MQSQQHNLLIKMKSNIYMVKPSCSCQLVTIETCSSLRDYTASVSTPLRNQRHSPRMMILLCTSSAS